MMPDLSILIPARNEMFLGKTIENILENIEGDTEIIAVCDGYWPVPGINDHPRVSLIHYTESVGQRRATNDAARLSRAKYIMKCDAHCAFDKGFDVKLMADIEYDWTVVPRMYNLHGFDWQCKQCGNRTYQGPTPTKCMKCEGTQFERVIVWQPRLNRLSDFARFDKDMHFQYWQDYRKRPESKGEIADLMCHVGACWMMHRERFWDLGGMDEKHGSWGQMGVEVSCKTWLSGGRQVVNKKTWYSHMFRTQGGDFGFPYHLSGHDVDKARAYSKDMWLNNKWPLAKHNLQWLLDKFAPVPGWDVQSSTPAVKNAALSTTGAKGVVYYTDNRLDSDIMDVVQQQILKCCNSHPIVSVSLTPIDFGRNIVLPMERGILTMFKQILAGLEAIDAEIVFFCEHDVLYHPSHFDFTPPRKDVFYYNENTWRVDYESGQALFYYCRQTSGLCAYRDLLIEHYRKRTERVERDGYDRRIGYEPGSHQFPRGIDNYISDKYWSEFPNIDIRHGGNLTRSRWSQDQFRDKNTCLGWTMADEVPYWDRTKGRFKELLAVLNNG
jgi:hypothetical protein